MSTRVIPEIDRDQCDLCGDCVSNCPTGALLIGAGGLHLDLERCGYCGDCEDICPHGAVRVPYQVVFP